MAVELYTVDREDMGRLIRTVQKLEATVRYLERRLKQGGAHGPTREDCLIGKTNDEIPARDDLELGSGAITVYRLKSDGTLEATSRIETVWNLAASEVADDTYVVVERHYQSGLWIVTVEDCG